VLESDEPRDAVPDRFSGFGQRSSERRGQFRRRRAPVLSGVLLPSHSVDLDPAGCLLDLGFEELVWRLIGLAELVRPTGHQIFHGDAGVAGDVVVHADLLVAVGLSRRVDRVHDCTLSQQEVPQVAQRVVH
jgi:hypothetical protein